jgi:hypothetical protein
MSLETTPERDLGLQVDKQVSDILEEKCWHPYLAGELRIEDVNTLWSKFKNSSISSFMEFIRKEHGSLNPTIRGSAEIEQGEKLVLLADRESQAGAFGFIYATDVGNDVPYRAVVKTAGEENVRVEDVHLVFTSGFHSCSSVNALKISKGLAEKLKITGGQDIVVEKIYQLDSDKNLDKLL